MFWNRTHLSDAELLLLEESALPAGRLTRARRHLARCPHCRDRSGALRQGAANLGLVGRDNGQTLPMPEVSRARLRARLEDASAHETGLPLPGWRPMVGVVVGLVAVAGLVSVSLEPGAPPASRSGPSAAVGTALPRPDLTPGAVRQVTVDEICHPDGPSRDPMVDMMTAQQVFEHYGADYRRAEEYELDFLITPELGGTADIRNLWPQPYEATTWNARVKDELEQLFRQRVCAGTMDIATAQQEIATDWIAAYRRYFETTRPREADTRRDG